MPNGTSPWEASRPDDPWSQLDTSVVRAIHGAVGRPACKKTWLRLVVLCPQAADGLDPKELRLLEEDLLAEAAAGVAPRAGACKAALWERLWDELTLPRARLWASRDRTRQTDANDLCNQFYAGQYDHVLRNYDPQIGHVRALMSTALSHFFSSYFRTRRRQSRHERPAGADPGRADPGLARLEEDEFRRALWHAVSQVLQQLLSENYPPRRIVAFRLHCVVGLTLRRTAEHLRASGLHPRATTNTVHRDVSTTKTVIRQRLVRDYPDIGRLLPNDAPEDEGR